MDTWVLPALMGINFIFFLYIIMQLHFYPHSIIFHSF